MSRTLSLVAALAGLTLAGCSEFQFTKLVDENTTLPGASGKINGYQAVAYDGNELAYVATTTGNATGIFRSPADARADILSVARLNDPAPGGFGTYVNFYTSDGVSPTGTFSLDAGQLVFQADAVNASMQNAVVIYRDEAAAPTALVDNVQTFLVNNEIKSVTAEDAVPRISNGVIAFAASVQPSPNDDAIVQRAADGTLTTVVRKNDVIPSASANFERFQTSPQLDSNTNTVVFQAEDTLNREGIYSRRNATVTRLIDTSMSIPSSNRGNFTEFGDFTLQGNVVYFIGEGANDYRGIFSVPVTGGVITTLVDIATPIQNSAAQFDSIFNVAPFGDATGSVLFSASLTQNPAVSGVFLIDDKGLRPVLTPGQILSGLSVFQVKFSPDSVRGKRAVLQVELNAGPVNIVKRLYLLVGDPNSTRTSGSGLQRFLTQNRSWSPGKTLQF